MYTRVHIEYARNPGISVSLSAERSARRDTRRRHRRTARPSARGTRGIHMPHYGSPPDQPEEGAAAQPPADDGAEKPWSPYPDNWDDLGAAPSPPAPTGQPALDGQPQPYGQSSPYG